MGRFTKSMVDGRLSQPGAWRVDDRSSATLEVLPAPTIPGGGVLQLNYAFSEEPGERALLLGPHTHLDQVHDHVSVYVHGYTSLHNLVFFIVDARGEYYSCRQIALDWTGWRRVQFRLTEGFRAHWGGSGSGTVEFPVRRAGFVLWRQDGAHSRSGRLLLGGLRFSSEEAALQSTIEDAQWQCGLAREAAQSTSDEIAARVRTDMARVTSRLTVLPRAGSRQDLQRAQDLADHCRYVANWLNAHTATKLIEEASSPPLAIGSVQAFSKVPPGEFPRELGTSLRLMGTRGEWVSAQIVVGALDQSLTHLQLMPRTLLREGGGAIPGHMMECNPLGLVEVRRGSESEHECSLWPDPLLPTGAIDIDPYSSRSFALSLQVPVEARPGLYDGEVALLIDGKRAATMPIELSVSPIEMPHRCSLPAVLGLNTRNVGLFYGEEDLQDEDYLEWVRFLLQRRMHGDRLLGSCHRTQQADQWLSPSPSTVMAAQSERFDLHWIARVPIQHLTTDGSRLGRAEKELLDKLSRRVDRLRTEGVLDKAYLYASDELGAGDYDRMLPFLSQCKRVAPELKQVLCFSKGDPLQTLGDTVDVWCPHLHWVAENQDKIKILQDSGSKVWWYFTEQSGGVPGVTIDAPAITHRVLFWMTFHFGFEGLLHWQAAFWADNMRTENLWPASRWMGSLLDEDTRKYRYHGEGHLLYPGPDKLPLSSLRLESLRQGAEDYELLRMLRQRLYAWDIPSQLAASARSLLDLSDLIRGLDDFETDPRLYDTRRTAIIDLLEQARD